MNSEWIFKPSANPAVEDNGYELATDSRAHVTACFDGTFSALLFTSETQCLYRDGFKTLAKAKNHVEKWIAEGK